MYKYKICNIIMLLACAVISFCVNAQGRVDDLSSDTKPLVFSSTASAYKVTLNRDDFKVPTDSQTLRALLFSFDSPGAIDNNHSVCVGILKSDTASGSTLYDWYIPGNNDPKNALDIKFNYSSLPMIKISADYYMSCINLSSVGGLLLGTRIDNNSRTKPLSPDTYNIKLVTFYYED